MNDSGAGILGLDSELYDSRPQQINFFDHIGRKIEEIYAGSTLSAVVATSSTIDKNSPQEVYVWGYVRDSVGRILKATQPVLVQHALAFEKIDSVYLMSLANLGIVGIKDNVYTLQVYSPPILEKMSLPHSPFYEDVPSINGIFTAKPFSEISLGKGNLSKFTIGNGEFTLKVGGYQTET